MSEPSHDPSIENEPHMRPGGFRPAPLSPPPEEDLGWAEDDEDAAVRSVWNEPGLSPELSGHPAPEALTYSAWLRDRVARTSAGRSWTVTMLVAMASGIWAVFGTFFTGAGGGSRVLAMVIFAPVVEETMKVALPYWVIERRPYLFRSRAQILICCAAGGLMFANLENLLYLHVYVPNPSPGLVTWRWTVCTALHVGCTLISGLGLARIWERSMDGFRAPQVERAWQQLVTAMALHGAYNALALSLALLHVVP